MCVRSLPPKDAFRGDQVAPDELVVAPGALVGIHRRGQEGLQRRRVVQDAGDERVSEPGQPKAAAAVVRGRTVIAREQRLGAGPQGQVEVQAGAGPVRERLGHERGGHAALLGQDVEDVAEA